MRLQIIENLGFDLSAPTTIPALEKALLEASRKMGFDHFALAYDEWLDRTAHSGILIHDYPSPWARVYTTFDLGRSDPIRRACERSFTGFAWRDLPRYVALTQGDRHMLSVGRDHGLSDGYTVPRHLPGLASGSCTFVVGNGKALPVEMIPVAEMLGALALTTARRIAGVGLPRQKPALSDRQRECIICSARGLTAAQTAKHLGISESTVNQHLRTARERYEVHCAEALAICALFDGVFGFADIFKRWKPH